MGRSTTKRQQGLSGQNNPKAENVSVATGRRIEKQRSNGHLNGQSKLADRIPSTPPPSLTPPHINGTMHAGSSSDLKLLNQHGRRVSVGAYSESSSSESYNHHNVSNVPSGASSENHRRIDVNATKNPAVHFDAGFSGHLASVLRSCPLWDTVAILIVLLQIPPTILTVVHCLFALLTFVPPSASGHTLSLTDIFEGSLSTPSIATILAIDFGVLLIWLFLWRPIQDISLDLAQSVIALTLGGGTSGRDAGYKNVFVCLGAIGLSHFARNGNLKKSGLRILGQISPGMLGTDAHSSLESSPLQSNKGLHAWMRIMLAIHILTQGVVRYIRDWYVRREKRDNLLQSNGDPEAAKIHMHNSESQNAELNPTHTSAILTPDIEMINSQPYSNGIDKASTAKKKRKAGAMVRMSQPLWSALASTKIVMAKEYETSKTAAESAGTNATDVNNLGNAPFDTEADRIWITYVGFDEVCFNTSFFPAYASGHGGQTSNIPGTDRSKPFYVRVNKSTWHGTKINSAEDVANKSPAGTRWSGEIFGLAPTSNYDCDFISTMDGSVLFSTSVRTMQPPTADAPSAPMLSPHHPQSPVTTLKTAIATSELQLNEQRNRLKTERKNQKSKLASIRKEIDRLASNILTAGSNDEKLRQKAQQSNLHAKQADDAVSALTAQLEEIEQLPEEEALRLKQARSAWQSRKDAHNVSRNELQEFKNESDRNIATLQAEVNTFLQKKEKMQSRIDKLNGEHERITDANAKGLDEAQRKENERAAKDDERRRAQANYNERIEALGPQIDSINAQLHEVWQNIQHIQSLELEAYNAHYQQTAAIPGYEQNLQADPQYPWNPTPGYGGQFGMGGVAMSPRNSQQGHRTRGRSSSMLSGVSGFTQSSGEGYDAPPLPRETHDVIDRERDLQRSEGSSSASGSVGDPKSPVPGYRTGTVIGGARFVSPWDNDINGR